MQPFDPVLTLIAAEAKVKTPHVFHCWHAMRELGTSFHRDAFAAFAGLERKHIDAIIAALEAHYSLPKAATAIKGHRLPHNWVLPDEWLVAAREKRFWTEADVRAEAEAFADYWHAKAGKDAVKLDWRLTWQSWVRNSHRPNGTSSPSSQPSRESKIDQLERAIATYERMGRHSETADMRRQLGELNTVIPFKAVG